ncbi:MAG TPA: hypothetical protein ENJ35_03990, partial [Gammaproteobacteria bacterium]|nr:hypothetical protein [Gammaproteobacteria bacterium]
MLELSRLRVVAGIVIAASAFPLHAQNAFEGNGRENSEERSRGHESHSNRHSRLKVALWGDSFYNDDPAIKSKDIDQTIRSMNTHNLDFTIFAGDTKNGHTVCTDAAIGQDAIDIFNRI